MTYQELRSLSLDFRRASSNLLNASIDDADVQLKRFKSFLDKTPFISDLIHKKIDDITYDFNDCFVTNQNDWNELCPPVDEACHIKAQYDYMAYICENDIDVLGAGLGYLHSNQTYGEIVRDFMQDSFKPLIDFLNDAISKEMILLEETNKQTSSMIQNFNAPLYGTAIQGTGPVSSTNTTIKNNDINEILALLDRVINSLASIDLPEEVNADVKDDLEVISEQLKSATPKKNRIQKALGGMKKFVSDFAVKLAVEAAIKTDWHTLITSVENFITTIF